MMEHVYSTNQKTPLRVDGIPRQMLVLVNIPLLDKRYPYLLRGGRGRV